MYCIFVFYNDNYFYFQNKEVTFNIKKLNVKMQIGCLPLIYLLLTDNTMYNALVAEQLMICYVCLCPTWISSVICGVLFICLMI